MYESYHHSTIVMCGLPLLSLSLHWNIQVLHFGGILMEGIITFTLYEPGLQEREREEKKR